MERSACRLAWSAVIVGWLVCSPGALLSADRPDPRPVARVKLERLLSCQQTEKDAALSEKRAILAKISDIETFIRSLTDKPIHYVAHEKASRALTVSRDALAKADERLRLADRQIDLTLRAMKYLPTASREESLSVVERTKLAFADWLADRKLHTDEEFAQDLQIKYGFVESPEWQERLTRVMDRLYAASPYADAPVTVRIVNRPGEDGAFARRSSIYFDKGFLDRNPSDDEVLFVAAHEQAHVQLHHVSLGVLEKRWREFEEDSSVEGSHPTYQNKTKHYDDAGWRTRMAQYYRDQEAQADLVGAQQALAAGASPRGIKDTFTRFFFDELKSKLSPDPDPHGHDRHYAEALRTHARPSDRLKALEEALGEKFWERTDLTSPVPCRHK